MGLPCFVANWKMYKTGSEALAYLETLQKRLFPGIAQKAQMILAPPYTALYPLYEKIQKAKLKIDLSAQNIYGMAEGAYTGEISAAMLYDAGCRYVIVGHSERRRYFRETDAEIAAKITEARKIGLAPILCVGETREEREAHTTLDVVRRQVQQGFSLETCGNWDLTECLIAYEPVWAIGTGKTPQPEEVEEVHRAIKRYLQEQGVAPDRMPRILYGGSVNEKNIAAFMEAPDVEGVLIGGASLSAEGFIQMIEQGLRVKELASYC